MNENPSVRIESAGSKTSDNRPLKNGSVISNFALGNSTRAIMHSKQYGGSLVCHLIKVKGYFFQPGRPVFIIVINTSCLGVCYRIYTRQKFLNNALMPNGALALFEIFAGRISCCNKRPHNRYLLLQQAGNNYIPGKGKVQILIFTSHSTARVILGQALSIATYGNRNNTER